MPNFRSASRRAPFICLLLLAACASTTPPETLPPPPSKSIARTPETNKPAASPVLETTALAAIDAASNQFDAGNFSQSIKTLTDAHAIDFASTETQIRAHKLLAFDYCSLNKTAQCGAEFSRILQMQPAYQLPEAERFHPVWGPAFETARKKSVAQR